MRPVDVRQGSLPGMAMPEMFMSVLSYAERNPRQVDVAVLAISPEFFRKLGLREEVKHMAADPQVHSALVSLLSNSSEFPAAYNVLEPLIAAPTWLIDWRRGWKLRPTTGACLQNANR